jgi:hypothetical protein
LVIDPDAPLAGAVSLECFQPVSGRYPQVHEDASGVQEAEFAQSRSLHVARQFSAPPAPSDQLGFAIGKALDHV